MKTITNLAYHIKNQYNDLSYFWQFVICLSLAFVTLALGISIFNWYTLKSPPCESPPTFFLFLFCWGVFYKTNKDKKSIANIKVDFYIGYTT